MSPRRLRRPGANAGRRAIGIALLGLGASLFACASPAPRAPVGEAVRPSEAFEWRLPAGFPLPEVPDQNPMSEAKVELGRALFYDVRLSGNGHFSCASCHRQELAFTDGRARALGSTGELHPRSAMSLTNVAYNAAYNWADPELRRLEDQALGPLLNRDPIELGVGGREQEVLERLRSDGETAAMFERAFPGQEISLANVTRAIAAFERTLISGNSPYDRFLFWDEPLGEAASRGMKLFFSQRTRCSGCHGGLNLSGPVRVAERSGEARVLDTAPITETGVRFRAPTLRNIVVTAPYRHDGSLETLQEVVRFYADGGRGFGSVGALEGELAGGFSLTDEELDDLVSFLEALTDREFLGDPRFANPRGDS